MNPYPAYKDSGIEWIGEIPQHWIKKKLKFIGKFSSSGIDKKIIEGEPKVKIVNFTDIYKSEKKILDSEIEYMIVSAPEKKIQKNLLKKGDLIFLPSSETKEDLGLSALVNENLENTSFSYHVIRFNFDHKIEHSFKKYLTNNNFTLNKFSSFGQGTTRQIIGRDIFNNMEVILPPLEEQSQIANYLDKKTAQIGSLIAKKENLIQLLEEEKTALINQAVTKGLDPNVKMKDSGIEWLGEIPEHWEVKKLKYLFSLGTGLSITKSNLNDKSGIPCVNYGEIHSKYGFEIDTRINHLKFIEDSYLETHKKALLKQGDFVFADTSEDIEGTGNFTHLTNDDEVFAGYHTITVKPSKEISSYYFAFEFNSIPFRNQIRQTVKGVKVYSITQSILKNIYLWMPPSKEQKKIAKYLKKESNRINSIINISKKEIELLKEYKTTLISEVVTGKVDVRF